jgi:transposase
MARLMLSDELWSKLRTIMQQQRIYDKPDLRLMVEAMLYRMRVGCPWRDLPAEFGSWNSIYPKFNRWSYKDKLKRNYASMLAMA